MTDQIPDGWELEAPSPPALPEGFEYEPPPMPMAQVGKEAAQNAIPSAIEFGKNMLTPITDPVGFAKGLTSIVGGYAQKLQNLTPPRRGPSILPPPGLRNTEPKFDEAPADAVNEHFKDRAGGWENIKRTVAKDPVGALADLSVVLTGGAALPARLPGIAGQTAKIANTVGRTIDPVNLVAKTAKLPGHLTALAGGQMTGTGSVPIREGFKAGKTGGDYAKTFLDNMHGNVSPTDVVQSARDAVDNLRVERGTAYRGGMVDISKDPTVLSFEPIDKAIAKAQNIGSYKGQVIKESAGDTWARINKVVEDWKQLDPNEFHTPEGLDALKQKIGDIRDLTQPNTAARAAVDTVYRSVREQIAAQAPAYGKVMKGYEEASDAIRELEKALSLGEKASADTALRKLQSIMRNNVNANYGKRAELGEELVKAGAKNLKPALAGQALSAWTPRGLQSLGPNAAGFASLSNPLYLATLPLMSPRLWGYGAYGLGAMARPASATSRAVNQFIDPYTARMLAAETGEHVRPGRGLFE